MWFETDVSGLFFVLTFKGQAVQEEAYNGYKSE
jgi:hypothetical protein